MALFARDFPFNDLIVLLSGKDKGKSTQELQDWAATLLRQAEASPVRPQPAEVLTDVVANAMGTLTGVEAAGLYRVTAYREVTVADPVSSSLAIAISWTHNGKALTRTLSAFTGAPQTTTNTAGDVTAIEIDPGTTISYALTYASNTPGLAQFSVTMSAELLQTIS